MHGQQLGVVKIVKRERSADMVEIRQLLQELLVRHACSHRHKMLLNQVTHAWLLSDELRCHKSTWIMSESEGHH